MLYGCITLIVPALGRLTAQISPASSFGSINWPLSWTIFLGILLSVPVYDFIKHKNIQKATILSFIALFSGMLLSVLIASTEIGKDLASFQILDK
jgi:flagellar biosynthesis protein FliR